MTAPASKTRKSQFFVRVWTAAQVAETIAALKQAEYPHRIEGSPKNRDGHFAQFYHSESMKRTELVFSAMIKSAGGDLYVCRIKKGLFEGWDGE